MEVFYDAMPSVYTTKQIGQNQVNLCSFDAAREAAITDYRNNILLCDFIGRMRNALLCSGLFLAKNKSK